MKRRSFFGVAAGAVVAGPGMAKEAVSQFADLAQLNIAGQDGGGLLSATQSTGSAFGYAEKMQSGMQQATAALAKLSGLTASQRSKMKMRQHVGALDPDIAGYRSISLHAKLDWQRERLVSRALSERKGMWQRIAEGLSDYDPDDYLI